MINNTPFPPYLREGIGPLRAYLAAQANLLTTLQITRIEVDGDTVSWDDNVIATDGEEVRATGHVAVIEDGKIVTWDFGSL